MQIPHDRLAGGKAYRTLVSLALEFKSYFFRAISGMVVLALSDAAFACLMNPMMTNA
jgi:hypothetical protein